MNQMQQIKATADKALAEGDRSHHARACIVEIYPELECVICGCFALKAECLCNWA